MQKQKTLQTTFCLPTAMRLRLDELRLERARRSGGLPPAMGAVVVEALEELLSRELEKSPK